MSKIQGNKTGIQKYKPPMDGHLLSGVIVLFMKDFDRHHAIAYSNRGPGEIIEVIRRALLAHFAEAA